MSASELFNPGNLQELKHQGIELQENSQKYIFALIAQNPEFTISLALADALHQEVAQWNSPFTLKMSESNPTITQELVKNLEPLITVIERVMPLLPEGELRVKLQADYDWIRENLPKWKPLSE